MRPIILKLLKQEAVTQGEWQDLFYSVHLVCLWDEKGPPKLRDTLKIDIMDFIQQAQQVSASKLSSNAPRLVFHVYHYSQRVLAHQEEQALLKAYITEWRKFFTQCNYLPTPFRQLETALAGKTNTQKRNQADESIVRKVRLSLQISFPP